MEVCLPLIGVSTKETFQTYEIRSTPYSDARRSGNSWVDSTQRTISYVKWQSTTTRLYNYDYEVLRVGQIYGFTKFSGQWITLKSKYHVTVACEMKSTSTKLIFFLE